MKGKYWLLVLIVGWLVAGCATLGTMTQTVVGASQSAKVLLQQLDSYYNKLVLAKTLPTTVKQATLALTLADNAAEELRVVVKGKQITDAQFNELAGKVEGAQAILKELGKE